MLPSLMKSLVYLCWFCFPYGMLVLCLFLGGRRNETCHVIGRLSYEVNQPRWSGAPAGDDSLSSYTLGHHTQTRSSGRHERPGPCTLKYKAHV